MTEESKLIHYPPPDGRWSEDYPSALRAESRGGGIAVNPDEVGPTGRLLHPAEGEVYGLTAAQGARSAGVPAREPMAAGGVA